MTAVPLLIGVGALALLAMAKGKKAGPAGTSLPTGPITPESLLGGGAQNASLALKEEIAKVLRRLNVQPDGSVRAPITKADIQVATALAGKLDRGGFREAGSKLRSLINAAARHVPAPPPSQVTNLPGVSPALRERINRALQLERDPAKLNELLRALKNVPASSERDTLITSIESLIAQLAAAASTAETLEATQRVIDSKPGGTPSAQTPAGRVAQQLAASIRNAENRYGVVGAKKRRDTALIKRFQKLAGLAQDGKPGVRTNFAMARLGVSVLPLVMYWPRGSTRSDLAKYKREVLKLAAYAKSMGQTQRAAELTASAQREQGQGGIIGGRR